MTILSQKDAEQVHERFKIKKRGISQEKDLKDFEVEVREFLICMLCETVIYLYRETGRTKDQLQDCLQTRVRP